MLHREYYVLKWYKVLSYCRSRIVCQSGVILSPCSESVLPAKVVYHKFGNMLWPELSGIVIEDSQVKTPVKVLNPLKIERLH